MTRTLRHFARMRLDQTGSASIEFVLMFPFVFALFFVLFEAGYMALRSTMLDRALDMTVRDLRLGNLVNPSVDQLRKSLCTRTDVFKNCEASVTLELTRVSAGFTNLPSIATRCVRRDAPIVAGTPSPTVQSGLENELIVLRACMVVDAIFPSSYLGVTTAKLAKDGTYALLATSAFVNEPN